MAKKLAMRLKAPGNKIYTGYCVYDKDGNIQGWMLRPEDAKYIENMNNTPLPKDAKVDFVAIEEKPVMADLPLPTPDLPPEEKPAPKKRKPKEKVEPEK